MSGIHFKSFDCPPTFSNDDQKFLLKKKKKKKFLKLSDKKTIEILLFVKGHNHLLEIRLLETGFLILFQPNP